MKIGIFEGATINTPSMLAVEDYIDALSWAEKNGGVDGLIKISEANLKVVADWVNATPWASFLAKVRSLSVSHSLWSCAKYTSRFQKQSHALLSVCH